MEIEENVAEAAGTVLAMLGEFSRERVPTGKKAGKAPDGGSLSSHVYI